MNGKPPSRRDDPRINGFLISAAAGALIAQVASLPLAIRLILLGMMATCLVLVSPGTFSSLGRAFKFVVFQLWWLFALLAVIILVAVILAERGRSALPEEVLQARHELLEIESRLPSARKMLLLDEAEVQSPPRRALMEGYEILEIDGGEVLRTYVRQGKKIAEDVHAGDPYPFARRYYHGPCNFATDHFDSFGRLAFLEYRQGCRNEPIILFPEPPRFLPPVPFFSYR